MTDATRRVTAIGAYAALTAVLAVIAGPVGAVAGVAAAATRYVASTPYAIAVGHVALLAAFPDGIDPFSLAVVVAGFALVALAAAEPPRPTPADAAVFVAGAAGFVGLAWLADAYRSPWIAAGALLAAVGLAGYALHRYELVRLGLVPDDRSPHAPTSDNE